MWGKKQTKTKPKLKKKKASFKSIQLNSEKKSSLFCVLYNNEVRSSLTETMLVMARLMVLVYLYSSIYKPS